MREMMEWLCTPPDPAEQDTLERRLEAEAAALDQRRNGHDGSPNAN